MRSFQLIIFAILIQFSLSAQKITGDWHGEIGGGKNKIQFIFHIANTDEGLAATMDIPARNLTGIKTQKTTFQDNQLHIDGKNFGFEYKGAFRKDSVNIEGHFIEGPNQVPLKLYPGPGDVVEKRVRPQEPTKPYPYKEEEVVFENTKDNVKLAGTLTIPMTGKKHPVAILITGSGPQNRDEEIFGHKPFLVLADHLTKLGIAVLRYDDRGVNESTGNFTEATSADFATDVESAIDYLKTRSDIDKKQIGLIGHSEGGIIAPMVAARSKDVDFMVLLAGTGVSGFETNLIQSVTLRKFPVPDEEAYKNFITDVLTISSADKDVKEVRQELTDYYNKSPFFEAMAGQSPQRDEILKGLVEARTTPWVRYFYHYNPADMIEKVKCPVLSINGTKDQQVVADVNQAGIRAALEKGKNKDYQVIALEGLNHFFQTAETGAMNEYDDIEETFSPEALTLVSDWILKRIK
ncbi:S9 family peptidase [Roseivirga sp. E12]|uniref:alpha/beta hydrolase family protein n=1 Tax=Roseivirga sp. E12 TaxID=2819237 RepID=UPI001ABBF9AD|nr:alpha/beta fold hydrolase [Roseivirga sp. E12]MBO3698263.1 alpha/beta fold hydrolase [Roseivirga sp. E12]